MENTGDTITAEESVSTETDSNADSESANALSESAPISNTEVTDDDQELKMEINSEDEVENSRTVELANKEPDSQRSENEASLSDHLETLEDENGSDKEELEKVSISNGAVEDKSVTKVPKGRKRKVTDTTLLPEQSSEKDDEKKPKPNDLDSELKPDSKDEPSFIEANLNLPTKEAFGKGKRARIPNKRYSDISLTSKQSANKSFENGSEKIELENEVVEEPLSPTAHKSKDNPTTTKKIKTVDMKDPKLLKPFKFGWRRELVWRGTPDSNNRLTSDIYYYTPHGKKVRSMREVADNLTNKELTLENFSYFKAPIGLDPDKETIRHAKKPNAQSNLVKKVLGKSTPKSPSLSPTPEPERVLSPKLASPKVLSPKNSSPKIVSSKPTSPKITSPKVTTPKVTSPKASKPAPKASTPKALSPKQVISETVEPTIRTRAAANRGATPKSKVPPKKDKRVTRSEETMEVDSSPATKPAPPKKGRWANFNEGDKPCQPCSIRCKGVQGLVPTLQCRICLCLYHHECVGIASNLSMLYVCKNCQLESQGEKPSQSPTLVAPPPLTPINTFKTTGVQSVSVLPKLQRIPRPDDPTFLNETDSITDEYPEMPSLISEVPKSITPPPQSTIVSETAKSLVGSVTTWLPHNSKIVDDIQPNCEEPTEVLRPQYVEYLAGRKFLVIPKHNFMTVSPTVAAGAVARTTLNNASENLQRPTDGRESLAPDPDPDPVSKPTSESPSKPENSHTPEAMEVDAINSPLATMETDEKTGDDGKISDQNEEANSTPAAAATVAAPKLKKRTIKLSSITNSEEKEENKFMENYLQNLSYGYSTLLYVFQYLKVQDLLRAGCVCTMWRDIAGHPMLWRTVRMKNSQVHSFEGLANSLKKHGTRHLDLRKMLLPNGGDEIWPEFSKAIEKVDTLLKIELCRCPASVVENLAISNPQLEVINAVTIKCESMDLEPLKALINIKELRLKSTGGLTLTSNLDSLRDMKQLRHLSLTSIRDLDRLNLNVIAELTNLESLDLGECTDFPKSFGSEILVKLDKLEKLRLEKGQGCCHTFDILDAVKNMMRLEQLELVNFDIKAGFDKALGVCQNIKKLLIIPTYISQSATTNHMVLGGVLRLQKSLSHFVWGVTLELLRVTELFVDQCEEPDKKDKRDKKGAGNGGDSIPVLKPVPLLIDRDGEIPPAHDPPQVEILALPSLQKLLMQNLPTTRVKILKIPFHATWRQSITDSVN